MRNEALELVKSLRKLLDQVDPKYIKWESLKKEMDSLIAKEEQREAHKPKPIKEKAPKKTKKGGNREMEVVSGLCNSSHLRSSPRRVGGLLLEEPPKSEKVKERRKK